MALNRRTDARFSSPCTKSAWMLLFTAVLLTTQVQAGIDFLEIPAYQSDRAARSLLLDVVNTGERLVAVGERGHIVYSTDQGRSWSQAEVPVYTTLTAIHFPVPGKGWAVGHEGVVLHSSDGGSSWVKQLDGYAVNRQVLSNAETRFKDARQMLADAADDEQRAEAEIQLEEAQIAMEDARDDAETGPAKPLLDVWFRDENEGFVVGSYGILLHTGDGGESWELWSGRLDNPDNFHLNAIAAAGSENLMLAGEAGLLLRSSDGGANWEMLDSPYDGSFFGLLSHNDAVFVFGLRGSLYRTDDFGDSWRSIALPTSAALTGGVVTAREEITLVGSAGAVAYSRDGGSSFTLAERPDRLPFSAIAEAGGEHLLAVGLRGVRQVDLRGVDLAAEE